MRYNAEVGNISKLFYQLNYNSVSIETIRLQLDKRKIEGYVQSEDMYVLQNPKICM